MKLNRLGTFFGLAFLFIFSIGSQASPGALTYQGRILKTDGSPLEHSNVGFIFKITDPSGQCLLYQEHVSGIDMTNSGGVFDVPIGTGTVDFPLNGGFSILSSFNNSAILSCGTCSGFVCSKSGSTYSGSGDDVRKLRVQFFDGLGWKTISPDNVIRSVPFAGYALAAEKLGTNVASDFLIKAGLPTCSSGTFLSWDGANLSCAPVVGATGGTVTNVTSANSYLAVANGTSAPMLTLNVGTGANTVAAGNDSRFTDSRPPTGNAGGDLTGTYPNPDIADGAVSTSKLFANPGVNRIIVTDSSTGATLAPLACSSGQLLTWNGSTGWQCTNPNTLATSSSANFSGSLAGDVNGTQGATSVNKLKGTVLNIGSLADGNFLKYNGTAWVNASLSSADLSNNTDLLKASNMPANCSASQTLTFLSPTGTWICSNIVITGAAFGSQSVGSVLAAPTGGPGTPSFRPIVSSDLPSGTVSASSASSGYHAMFSGTSTITNSNVYEASGKIGVGTTSPTVKLDVIGEIKVGNSGTVCSSETEGALRYNASSKRMEFCNGTLWSQISAGVVASLSIGSPSVGLVKSGPVSFLVTYGSGVDIATINLTSANISLSGSDISGCAVTGVANTSSSTRTVTVNGCTGTGTVAISIAANTANSTTGDPAPAAGPSSTFNVDNSGPTVPGGITLGSVPTSLSSSPTISYSASTDIGYSTVANYQVQILRTSDSAVIQAWVNHISGNAITGLSLSPSTQYSVYVRAVDSLGNIGAASTPVNWTSINGFPLTVTIATNTTNYNIRSAAIAAGWDQVMPVIANITINSGVVVYSGSVVTPAFATGTLTAGSTVNITNNGGIYGGAVASGAPDKTLNQAWEGGTALQIDYVTTLNNNGLIVGGSGGGGAGEGDSCGGCGGGNGATAGGNGGAAVVFNANATITNSNGIYGAGGGGAGGGGAYAAGVGSGYGGDGQGGYNGTLQGAIPGKTTGVCSGGYGGNGGTYGQPGAPGGNCGNGGNVGGAGGYAMVLNGRTVNYNSSVIVANSSYTEGTWISGTKGRIAP